MPYVTTRIAIATTIGMMALLLSAFAFGQNRFDAGSASGPILAAVDWQAVPATKPSAMFPAVAEAPLATMRFSMTVPTQGGQAGSGRVSGDMIGHLYARLTDIDRTAPVWLLAYDWTFAAGPDTFTATLSGTYDSEHNALHLTGRVNEGRLRGARITSSASHSGVAGGHYRGTFQIHQD